MTTPHDPPTVAPPAPAGPPSRPVTLDGDDLDELALLVDGLLDGDRYGRDGVAALRVDGDVEVGATLELRDPDGTHLASAEAHVVGGSGVTTGPVTSHRRPRSDGFADLLTPADELRAGAPADGELLAWQPTMPPAADAVAEVVATVTERGAALLFSPVLTARAGRAWAAELRAARRVRDHLADRLGADRVVTRALPPVVAARGYGEVVARRIGAVDLLEPAARGGVDAEVAALVAAGTPGPGEQGVVLLLTGLSGSGKSTVAQRLYGRLLEDGRRTVTLLDGDLVRRSLSSELTFSKEHRDLNVRRIGFVAAEVARHGGIALLAPIAPYDAPRRDVRRLVEDAGGRFVLVHVDTPLEVCEQRDVKGLYAAARAGRIPNFTGISDPYEVPQDADLRLDTSAVSLDDAVDQLLELLTREGHLPG